MSDRNRAGSAAEVAAGSGLTLTAFGNRVPETINAGHAQYVRHKQRRLGTTGALDANNRPVDPATLSNESHVPRDESGRPNGKRQPSPQKEARGRYTKQYEGLSAKLRKPLIHGDAKFPIRIGAIVGGSAVGVPLAWHGARKLATPTTTSKAVTDKDVDAFVPAALAAGGLHHAASYGYSYTAGRKQEASTTPEQREVLRAHREKHGMSRGNHTKGDRAFIGFNRDYPKELPGWKARRAMSWTHAGKAGMATTAGVATAAGLGTVAYQRSKVKKAQEELQMPYWYRTGIPASRAQSDPVSPLAMWASSRIMLDNAAALMGRNLTRRERQEGSKRVYSLAGARGLVYSPLGMIG